MLDLAAEGLAPSFLADLLGLHPGTAVKWVHAAGGDWTDYVRLGTDRSLLPAELEEATAPPRDGLVRLSASGPGLDERVRRVRARSIPCSRAAHALQESVG